MSILSKIEKAIGLKPERKRKRRSKPKARAKKRRSEPRKKNGEFKKKR